MTDAWIAVFDQVAESYDTVVPFFSSFGQLTVAALPPPAKGTRLLDVGAGTGAVALAARLRGYEVFAVDGSAAMVSRLSALLPTVQVADAAALPFDVATFDVVTAGFVVHLLSDPRAALREFKRVLVPGGLLALTVTGPLPEGFEPGDRSNELFAEFSRYLPADGPANTAFDARAALASTGFRNVTQEHLEVELELADPEAMWRWYATHGTRRFFDALDKERREEFRQRLVADLAHRPEVVLRRAASLFTART
ncbi:methyltransferase domain-containing protein [Actinoplanes sp. NPDC024001]|uniref:class I SAM-dependent methyltransferase n=1 Tax=Actinoplanes sp. NPDC024001 TaxID=3154598 RepID=UPI0033C47953